MNIFEKVKQETFIFSDEQIKEKIKQLGNIQDYSLELVIMHSLYDDKKSLTKEEYTKEVIQYLYAHSSDSKDKIDSIVEENKSWFYDQYKEAIENKKEFYHAVRHTRNELMCFLRSKSVIRDENDPFLKMINNIEDEWFID